MVMPIVPEAVSQLNQLERHLVAIRIAFIRMYGLSVGRYRQAGTKGAVANVVPDMSVVQTALPRTLNESMAVFLKLKRRMADPRRYKCAPLL